MQKILEFYSKIINRMPNKEKITMLGWTSCKSQNEL